MMFAIQLAGIVFRIDNRYSHVEELCRDYLVKEQSGEIIRITDKELEAENKDGGNWTPAYLESLAVYRKICERVLEQDIVLFHCSALAMDGKAYLFTAPSGTGKSTHARLWRNVFGDQVTVINDDKPLISVKKDQIIVYGTPYGGKDGLQTNTSAPVGGIVVLRQAPENKIRRLSPQEAFPMLLNQTYRRNDAAGMLRTVGLVQLLSELPIYQLDCTISREAVEICHKALTEA